MKIYIDTRHFDAETNTKIYLLGELKILMKYMYM